MPTDDVPQGRQGRDLRQGAPREQRGMAFPAPMCRDDDRVRSGEVLLLHGGKRGRLHQGIVGQADQDARGAGLRCAQPCPHRGGHVASGPVVDGQPHGEAPQRLRDILRAGPDHDGHIVHPRFQDRLETAHDGRPAADRQELLRPAHAHRFARGKQQGGNVRSHGCSSSGPSGRRCSGRSPRASPRRWAGRRG